MTHTASPLVYKPARWSLSKAAPSLEPVPLDVAKAHLRTTAADDDALIAGYVATARELVEEMTNRALMAQTWTLKIDRFPVSSSQVLELPGGRVLSVTSIKYLDGDGVEQTWASSNYSVDTAHEPGRVGLAYSASWPSHRDWDLPITVVYSVGYGADPADVPESLRTAVQMIAAELYENREESVIGVSVADVPVGARRLAYAKRIHPSN